MGEKPETEHPGPTCVIIGYLIHEESFNLFEISTVTVMDTTKLFPFLAKVFFSTFFPLALGMVIN